ncbi:MAG TPA: amidohydrolase family protein [Methanoregulaceae archaeon]|nr:amidohydrolase family protein [Methanoregulaceae archaeon]HQJ87323.1 amidohydrolase family protein [Methanoregulaceae archaeon]
METDIFEKRAPILVQNVRHQDRPVDLVIADDGTIAAIGPGTGREHEYEHVIEGRGRLLLPGLANTHTHAAMTLLRGFADDMLLQPWLAERIWPLEAHLQPDDVYWGTRLACLEMIMSGTVAFNDMYFFMEEAARAVVEAGLRGVLSYGFIDLGDAGKRERECRATESFIDHVSRMAHPRITACVGPHAVYTVSFEGLSWCGEYARERGLGVHVHLAETRSEVEEAIAATGRRPVTTLDEAGLLGPRTVAAHGCWLDDDECRLLAARGATVSHNPASNMKLSTGRAMPYPALRAAGARVALGTDGCASNNNLDLFEEMKIAALLQKFAWNDPTTLPAREALALATVHGHRALGLGGGLLEPGAPADLILVETHIPSTTPLFEVASSAVYACSGCAVTTTICDGRVLMHERFVPGSEEVLVNAARSAHLLVERAGLFETGPIPTQKS